MADLNTTVCDKCSTVKGSTNHWYQVRVQPGRIIIAPFGELSDRTHDACGINCLMKIVNIAVETLSTPNEDTEKAISMKRWGKCNEVRRSAGLSPIEAEYDHVLGDSEP